MQKLLSILSFAALIAACSSTPATSQADAAPPVCTDQKVCNADTDCKCTHHCLPLVPNGIVKVCTIPCTKSSDCNHPEIDVTCSPTDTGCCQAANACFR